MTTPSKLGTITQSHPAVCTEPLAEKYRPTCWADVVGQTQVVDRLQRLARRGWLPGRAYWISGRSGTGKTTIARLLANEIADPFFVQELDAGVLTLTSLQELERGMATFGWGAKPGRAYILNEAHGLRKPVIRQLLVLLERLPRHVVVVFTSTAAGTKTILEDCDDASPLLSRCLRFDLEHEKLSRPFAELCRLIAQAEGLDGQSIEVYLKLARRCGNNLRAMLMAVEAGKLCAEDVSQGPAQTE
jgi:replication-associated recombination protein RarA